jgi:hypothetical protein
MQKILDFPAFQASVILRRVLPEVKPHLVVVISEGAAVTYMTQLTLFSNLLWHRNSITAIDTASTIIYSTAEKEK